MTTTMNKPLAAAEQQIEVEKFISTVAEAPMSALLLDYDGTLAPFSADRKRATPYPGVTALLQKIMVSGKTRVAIITGRSAREVISLLGIDRTLEVWGSHGFERLKPGEAREMPHVDPDVSQALLEAGGWLTDQGLQHLAEFKPGGIAVHWRGFPEPSAAEVRERVLRGWFPIAQRAELSVLEFDGGVEIRVADPDKGDAVRTIIQEMSLDAPIAYLGDDATDERAFAALGSRGLSILVRPKWRRTSARLWLKPPDDLLDFLTQWQQSCCRPNARSESDLLSQNMQGALP
jgi:trehalose-phosphatase